MTSRWLGTSPPRNNNFDVVRLFAASQVVLVHASSHLGVEIAWPWAGIISLFPGVPIFFFISGILVTSSLSARDLASYATARARRVLPALWLAFFISLMLLFTFGQISSRDLSDRSIWVWIFTQITVFQVYNPDAFRDFGVGVVNGSLWTIPVEIGFYCILPALVWITSAFPARKKAATAILSVAALVSFVIGQISETGADTSFLLRIVHFSPAAHFWQFALGSLTYLYFERISAWTGRLCATRLGLLLPALAYVLFGLMVSPMLPKLVGIISTTLLLYALVLAAAVNARPIAGFLKGNDISYGVYLFHMLVTNALVELEMRGAPAVFIVFAATFGLAWLSWNLVESRALGRKSLRKHQAVQASAFSVP